jgi:hypothetical protein
MPDEEARAKADEIRKKLLEGDFEQLAAKFSNDLYIGERWRHGVHSPGIKLNWLCRPSRTRFSQSK